MSDDEVLSRPARFAGRAALVTGGGPDIGPIVAAMAGPEFVATVGLRG